MGTWFHHYQLRELIARGKNNDAYAQNMRVLFDRCFLHDGHIGVGSSFFDVLLPSAGVDSALDGGRPFGVNRVN